MKGQALGTIPSARQLEKPDGVPAEDLLSLVFRAIPIPDAGDRSVEVADAEREIASHEHVVRPREGVRAIQGGRIEARRVEIKELVILVRILGDVVLGVKGSCTPS